MGKLVSTFEVDAPIEDVWKIHQNPAILKRITPPGMGVRLPDPLPSPADGVRFTLHLHPLGLPFGIPWESKFSEVHPPHGFVDTQGKGPFGAWKHSHQFESIAGNRTRIIEAVEWEAPFGLLGKMVAPWTIAPSLAFLFWWRKRQFQRILSRRR
jgi:ligand-binding SRPBCC domain-containing protein